MAYVQSKAALVVAKRKKEAETSEVEIQRAALQDVRRCFPAVAAACNIKEKGKKHRSDKLAEVLASKYAKLCFQFRATQGFGIKPARLHTFAFNLLHTAQSQGLLRMLYLCARFKAYSADHIISVGTSHEFDSTRQEMALAQIQRLGRPATRRVGCDVMFQVCRIHVELDTGTETSSFSEAWLIKPKVVMGKTANFIVKCIEDEKPLNLEDASVVRALSVAVDTCVEQLRCDKGANNFPAIRHFASILESKFDRACSRVRFARFT
jgi:hypothetical protein